MVPFWKVTAWDYFYFFVPDFGSVSKPHGSNSEPWVGVKATFCQAQWQLLPCPAARFALGHRSPQLYCTLHPATFNSCPAPEQPFPSPGAVCPAGSRISTSPFAVESFKYRLPGALSLDRNNAVKTASGSEREEPRAWFEIPFLSG